MHILLPDWLCQFTLPTQDNANRVYLRREQKIASIHFRAIIVAIPVIRSVAISLIGYLQESIICYFCKWRHSAIRLVLSLFEKTLHSTQHLSHTALPLGKSWLSSDHPSPVSVSSQSPVNAKVFLHIPLKKKNLPLVAQLCQESDKWTRWQIRLG